MHYYLSPWVYQHDDEFPHWSPPDGSVGAIDLRNVEECARSSGSPDSGALGLFTFPEKKRDLGIYLGSEPDARVKKKERRSVESALRITRGELTGVTVSDVIVQLLTEQSDPTGVDRWKPLMSRSVSMCGCDDIVTGGCHSNTEWLIAFIAAKQHDFRGIYQELLDGSCHEDHPGMVLDYWSKRYGIAPEAFVPKNIPTQEIKPHATTVGDTFEGVAGTLITAHTATGPNGGFGWTAINGTAELNAGAGDSLIATGGAGFQENNFRGEGVVSGDDHYAQAEYTYFSGGNHDLRICTRFSAVDWTCYILLANRSNSNRNQLFKVVAGVGTLINNYDDPGPIPVGRQYRLESDGSSHTPVVAGVALAAQTDTTITGNFRGGIGGRGANTWINNYELSDLVTQSMSSFDGPVLDASTGNTFRTSGFSGNVTSAIIESVGGSYSTPVAALNNAIKNNLFNDGINDWDALNSVLTINAGALRVTSIVGGVANAQQAMSGLVIGQSYTVRCDYVTDAITGSFLIKIGTNPGSTNTALVLTSIPGPVEVTFIATQSTHHLSLGTTSIMLPGEFFDVDNVYLDNNFTFDMPDVAGFVVDTPGVPFESASYDHTFTTSLPPESASVPIVVHPQIGWQVVEVVGAVTTPGSVFDGFVIVPTDGDQVYWPTANSTSVAADGTLATGQVGGSIGMIFFNTVSGRWEPFQAAAPGVTPGGDSGTMFLLGVG